MAITKVWLDCMWDEADRWYVPDGDLVHNVPEEHADAAALLRASLGQPELGVVRATIKGMGEMAVYESGSVVYWFPSKEGEV